jgi:hypothetical protein
MRSKADTDHPLLIMPLRRSFLSAPRMTMTGLSGEPITELTNHIFSSLNDYLERNMCRSDPN